MSPVRGRPSLRPEVCRNIAWQPEGWKIKKKKKKRRDTKSGRPCMSESVRSAILTITVPLATNPSPPSSSGSTTPLTTCAGPTSPSFRVLTERRRGSGLRKRPASKATPEPAEVEESSDEDDTEDHSYERRHQPFEQLERLGHELRASAFELMARRAAEATTRDDQLRTAAAEDDGASPSAAARARREGASLCHGSGVAPATKPQLPAETAIRRLEVMRAGPVPLGRCAACAPHFKHTPHTCAAKRRGELASTCAPPSDELAASGGCEAESGCQACAPR